MRFLGCKWEVDAAAGVRLMVNIFFHSLLNTLPRRLLKGSVSPFVILITFNTCDGCHVVVLNNDLLGLELSGLKEKISHSNLKQSADANWQ